MNWQEIVKQSDLDVSVVNFDELIGRLDSEYYQKDYVNRLSLLSRKRLVTLKDIGFITDGEHGSPDWDQSSGIKYITAENIKANYIQDNDNFNNISKKQFERNKRASLTESDVLIYSVGMNAGLVAKMEAHLLPASIPRSVAIVRPKNLSSEYLSVFLNSKYGKFQSERLQAGNAQPVLSLNNIQRFHVAVPNHLFQMKISELYNSAYESRLYSRNLYSQAEALLLTELGLANYVPNEANTSIRDLFECLQDDRFDAEYWMPKYDEIIMRMSKNPLSKLGEIADAETGQYIAEYAEVEDGNKPFIRGTNISKLEIEEDDLLYVLPEDQKKKHIAVKNDVVVARVGSIGLCARIQDNLVGSTISDNLIAIRIKDGIDLNSYYLTVYLNSFIGQELMNKYSRGSVQQRLNQETLKELPIPIIDRKKQEIIANIVIDAHSLRRESKYLLEKAKRAVEVFIEQDEAKALEYLAV